ncbi:MAG: hypothetical protein BWY52_01979 [Chloroflexi bacterium ADurb.Bin325]|nr:MAG: hypothetical protein BWY52_01979 [Chloroflexi bacterium ADurb.Bin325]
MRRVLSAVIAIALLLGLGTLAVLALPGAGAPMTASPVAAAPLAVEPDAPAGTNKVNVIAMPLDATQQFIGAGVAFDADGLATIVGAGVQQVLTWDAVLGGYRTWYPIDEEGENFPLSVGGVYRLVLDSNAGSVVSFVGDVPPEGSISFSLARPTGAGCLVNDISLPLDRADIISANQLALSVGNVSQVLEWIPANQGYKTWYPQDQEGEDFPIKIGYPYRFCLLSGGNSTWP